MTLCVRGRKKKKINELEAAVVLSVVTCVGQEDETSSRFQIY